MIEANWSGIASRQEPSLAMFPGNASAVRRSAPVTNRTSGWNDPMLDPLTLVVDLLAVYRLTRLIVKDSLLNEVRWWILRRWPSAMTTFPDQIVVNKTTTKEMTIGEVEGITVYLAEDEDDGGVWYATKTYKLTEFIECVYCASIYVAFGVLALRVWWDWWQYPALALALAGGVALIFSKWDTE